MMKKLTDLNNLFQYELVILLDGEMEFQNYLSHIINRTFSSELKEILSNYRKINIEQVLRLEKVIHGNRERYSDQMINTVMRELIFNANTLFEMSDDPEVRDVIIVISIQRINNYKIASYGALFSYADALRMNDTSLDLNMTLNEEKQNYKYLSELRDNKLNKSARIPISDL
jgi:ferritin-like metal-binding protein YciE